MAKIVILVIFKVLIAMSVLASCKSNQVEKKEDNSFLPVMVTIPAGNFVAGSDYANKVACTDKVPPAGVVIDSNDVEDYCREAGPSNWFHDELPLREVKIGQAFELSQTEITIGLFQQFVDATGYTTDAQRRNRTLGFDTNISEVETFYAVEGFSWKRPWPEEATDQKVDPDTYPAVHVAYKDAVAYCIWLSGKTGDTWRLPTAEEWEYAALGGQENYPTSGTFSWGTKMPEDTPLANVSDVEFANLFESWKYPILSSHRDRYPLASPIKSFPANGYGLFDMTGNVWEWTSDHIVIADDSDNKRYFSVMKGGSFDFEMPFQRVQKKRNLSFVQKQFDVNTSISVGFRVVKEID